MSEIDPLRLDGHLLRLLLAVLETGSITGAAERLQVTQSAVSHLLDKLRGIVGDPLFVKSGRGIVPTARAEALAPQARELLDALQRFAHAPGFDPAQWQRTVTIAANDLQRDLLLPALLERLRAAAPGVVLRVIASGVPNADMLRSGSCDLVISPRPPQAGDVVQTRLFDDRYRVFHDPGQREPVRSLDEYLAAEHVTVLYEPARRLDIDEVLLARGIKRRFVALVPGFAGVRAMLRGSRRLATLPGLLERGLLAGLAAGEPPFDCPPMPMYMLWQLRHQHDPAHAWLRAQVLEVVGEVLR